MSYMRKREDDPRLDFLSGLLGTGPQSVGRRPFRDLRGDLSSQPFFGFPGGRLGWVDWRNAGAPESLDLPAGAASNPNEAASAVRGQPGFGMSPLAPAQNGLANAPAEASPTFSPEMIDFFTRTAAPPPRVTQGPAPVGIPIKRPF